MLLRVTQQPGWEVSLGRMDTCKAESLRASPEAATTLLIDCTPIQNETLKKKATGYMYQSQSPNSSHPPPTSHPFKQPSIGMLKQTLGMKFSISSSNFATSKWT